MKRFGFGLLAVLGAVVFSMSVYAASIVDSPHNLGSGSTFTDAYRPTGAYYQTSNTDQTCVFCHSPHGGGDHGLWNRPDPSNTYTYSYGTAIAHQPGGESLHCLSCHDGTVALDSLINGAGPGNYNPDGSSQGWTWTDGDGVMNDGRVSNLGVVLSNDHPVSFIYGDVIAITDNLGEFQAQVDAEAAGLEFYMWGGAASGTGTMECGTCHNVHDYGDSADMIPFLRVTANNSTICTSCHIK